MIIPHNNTLSVSSYVRVLSVLLSLDSSQFRHSGSARKIYSIPYAKALTPYDILDIALLADQSRVPRKRRATKKELWPRVNAIHVSVCYSTNIK